MPPKPEPDPKPILELLRKSAFSFLGTVEKLGAATMAGVPVNGRTAIVHVDQVLHSPEAFSRLAGGSVTVQLAARGTLPRVGARAAFFANAFAFGESIALTEVGRLPVRAVQPQLAATTATGGGPPFAALEEQIETDRLREHASAAEAVVVGVVTRLEQMPTTDLSEHAPQWWRATLDVDRVERGKGKAKHGSLDVLYANSIDVRWRDAPKPKAGQSGLWILHATKPPENEAAPFVLLHPEDYQPVQSLDDLGGSPAR